MGTYKIKTDRNMLYYRVKKDKIIKLKFSLAGKLESLEVLENANADTIVSISGFKTKRISIYEFEEKLANVCEQIDFEINKGVKANPEYAFLDV